MWETSRISLKSNLIFHCVNKLFKWSQKMCKFLALRLEFQKFFSPYRVSHGKVNKVIWLCWGYIFWFLLIFFILHVHEIWPFMPSSSFFTFLMLRALYRILCENAKSFLCKNSLNVSNEKLFSKTFFNVFGFFMPFWWEWQLAFYISSDFPGIKNLNSLNDLNSLNNFSGLNDLYSLISSKYL
jgi:hypothetical protein